MAQPQAYNREVDFTERDGDDTNHAGINAELDAAALSINQIRDNLELIQKDDGSLQNGIVGAEQLAPTAFDAIKTDLNEAVTDAQTAAASSTLAANTSIAARDAALAAQAAAETANTSSALNATTASTKAAEANASAAAASTSATASSNSATASQTSRLASEAARDAAQAAQAAATASQSAAAASQTAAATSETNAATSAATATTQAGIATTQATSAAASATAAAASLDSFDDRYLGPKSAAPTTDNDGNALLTGALYFDTTAAEMRVYTGSVWKAIGSAVNGTTNRASYTATAGQTTFAIVYDVGFVDVYLNGLKLQAGVDFTATNGTSIVLATGATVGDVVDIVAYGVFTVANTYTKTEADALLAAKANQATTYTKTEVDAALATKQAADAELTTLAGMSASRATYLASNEGFGFRNRIINGGMGIWQRGTTFSAVGYAQDRWFLFAPSGSVSASRSTDVPSGFQFSAEMTGTNVSFTQRIESANCFDLVGGSVTVSFWAKNVSGTQDLFVALQNPTAVDNWTSLTEITSAQVSASPSTNWTYYTITFNSLPAGVANGLSCVIGRGAGGSTTTRITGVQLEAGSVATPFERRPYGTELALCQRYFELFRADAVGYSANSFGVGSRFSFCVTKRAAPTITQISNNVSYTQSNVTASTSLLSGVTEDGVTIYRICASTGPAQFSEVNSAAIEL